MKENVNPEIVDSENGLQENLAEEDSAIFGAFNQLAQEEEKKTNRSNPKGDKSLPQQKEWRPLTPFEILEGQKNRHHKIPLPFSPGGSVNIA